MQHVHLEGSERHCLLVEIVPNKHFVLVSAIYREGLFFFWSCP
jgi:hypothetical protein